MRVYPSSPSIKESAPVRHLGPSAFGFQSESIIKGFIIFGLIFCLNMVLLLTSLHLLLGLLQVGRAILNLY